MARKLTDIRPGDNDLGEGVSLVHRGANRRRFLLAKADGTEISETLADVLAAPAQHEALLLDAIRKTGGDETVEEAAAAYARAGAALTDAYNGNVPAEVRKAAMKQMPDDDEDEGTDDEDKPDDLKGEGPDEELAKAYEAIIKRTFTADDRKKLADSGAALGDGSYPIENADDLSNAVHAIGRGKAPHAEIKAHIIARAKALGATAALPDDWKVNKEDGMTETAQAVPVKKEDGTWDLSAVHEDSRAAFEAVIKAADDELAELRKAKDAEATKAENAEKIAKAVQEKIEKAEFAKKAEGYTNLAKTADEIGDVLYSVAKAEEAGALPAGTSETLDTVLAAANEAAADVFKTAGRVGHSTGTTDAETKLESAAAEIRKSDSSLTKEQATARALKNDPNLYDEYQKAVA